MKLGCVKLITFQTFARVNSKNVRHAFTKLPRREMYSCDYVRPIFEDGIRSYKLLKRGEKTQIRTREQKLTRSDVHRWAKGSMEI